MRLFRRLAVGLAALSLVSAGIIATPWLIAANGAAAATQSAPAIAPNGVNFVIHSEVDQNYCLEDTPAPDNPASEASLSQCAVRDDQEWTFANAADGSLVIIGGTAGNCLDFSVKKNVSMTPCTFGTAEHFLYSNTGQIESTSKTKCLQAAAATQNAQTSVVKCQKGVELQIWKLSH
jgi:hypothetical protein